MKLRDELMLAEAEYEWHRSRREFAQMQVVYRRMKRLKKIQLDAEISAAIASGDMDAATEAVGA